MRVSRIMITNVLGIEELEIETGKVTVIEGANGTGKTSVIEAIRAALGGSGNDATLIRNGQSEGSVVLILDDGTEIWRRQQADRAETTVRDPRGWKQSAPARFLKSLVGPAPLDPAAFITMQAKPRVDYLLKTCPATVTEDDLQTAVGDLLEVRSITGEVDALAGVQRLRQALYERRRDINAAARDKQGAYTQLMETLPEGEGEFLDPSSRIAELQQSLIRIGADRRRLAEDHGQNIARINLRAAEEREAALAASQAIYAERRGEINHAIGLLQQKIRELQDQLSVVTAEELQRNHDDKDRIAARMNLDIEASVQGHDTREKVLDGEELSVSQELATLQERHRVYAQTAKTLEIIDAMKAEHTELATLAEEHSEAIDALDELKRTALSRIPVAGLDVRDDDIYVGDVPFDRLNRARQVEIAVDLAKLGAGDLGFICIDNLECLDPETLAAFNERQSRGDIQLLYARVADSPLSVKTINDPESPAETQTCTSAPELIESILNQ